jgi:hypothetical protein
LEKNNSRRKKIMYKKSNIPCAHGRIMGIMLLLLFVFITGVSMAAPSQAPFSLNYNLTQPVALGPGVSGEMLLALTNISDSIARDIIIRLPKDARFLFGPNNQCQAGTLGPGEQTVILEHLFDPQGISKNGSLDFIIDYTGPDGARHTAEISAVGTTEVDHE